MRPRPVVGEATVPDAVRRLLDKFDYPDREAPAQVIPILPTLGGGGGTPTIVVAASDASELSKSKADLVCTGVDDELVVQAAVDALPTSPRTSGRVVLTEGTFVFSGGGSADLIEVSNQRWVQGNGPESTIVEISGNATTTGKVVFDLRGGSKISDLRIAKASALTLDANSYTAIGLFGSAAGCVNVEVVQQGGSGGTVRAAIWSGNGLFHQYITDCLIDQPPQDGIFVNSASYITVAGTKVRDPGRRGITFQSVVVGAINGCHVYQATDDGCWLNFCDDVVITSSTFQSDTSGSGLKIDGAATGDNIIDGVWLDGAVNGLEVDDVTGCVFAVVRIVNAGQHGIIITDASDNLLADCLVSTVGVDADNTYDGIILAGNSDRNDLWNNKIIGASGAPQPRYGINISAATCDDNSYLGNRTGPAANYGTGAYNDAGTGTINTWPGAAAPQGDNLL